MDGDAARNGGIGTKSHLAYCLTYEEDTGFFRRFQTGEFRQNSHEDAEFFAATMDFLNQQGFAQYEISNYARPERECLHNLAYWHGKDYLGLGQVHSPLSESTVGKISLTRKPTSQKPRWEIRPGYAKSFWRKRPENRNA